MTLIIVLVIAALVVVAMRGFGRLVEWIDRPRTSRRQRPQNPPRWPQLALTPSMPINWPAMPTTANWAARQTQGYALHNYHRPPPPLTSLPAYATAAMIALETEPDPITVLPPPPPLDPITAPTEPTLDEMQAEIEADQAAGDIMRAILGGATINWVGPDRDTVYLIT